MMLRTLAVAAVLVFAGSVSQAAVWGFAPPAPPPPPTERPAEEPSLDELLGLPKQPRPEGEDPGVKPLDPATAELDRQLAPEEVSEEFTQAVRLMDQTASRIEAARDTGIETQRLQEEVLRKLDILIDQAERQQSSSSSRRRSQSQQQQQNQGNQQQQQSSQTSAQTNDPKAGGGPARQDGPGNRPLTGSSSDWGSLPQHLRDALVNGRDEPFSSKWKSLTQEYYKRLAEEAKPAGGPR